MIVDPFNENTAITKDGKLAGAVRFGKLENPDAPTVAEVAEMPIIGYAEAWFGEVAEDETLA